MTALMGTRKPRVVDFVAVGQQHALAAWEKCVGVAIADGVSPLERVPCDVGEAEAELLMALYGPIQVADFRAYRDAYRSALHSRNLTFEVTRRRALRLQGVR